MSEGWKVSSDVTIYAEGYFSGMEQMYMVPSGYYANPYQQPYSMPPQMMPSYYPPQYYPAAGDYVSGQFSYPPAANAQVYTHPH